MNRIRKDVLFVCSVNRSVARTAAAASPRCFNFATNRDRQASSDSSCAYSIGRAFLLSIDLVFRSTFQFFTTFQPAATWTALRLSWLTPTFLSCARHPSLRWHLMLPFIISPLLPQSTSLPPSSSITRLRRRWSRRSRRMS